MRYETIISYCPFSFIFKINCWKYNFGIQNFKAMIPLLLIQRICHHKYYNLWIQYNVSDLR